MKYIKICLFALFFTPSALFAASDFETAAQLLSAAKNADIAQVQALVNNGADINYMDNTGLSIVCTALMNNDVRAAQILQMYGADASKCDQQIKQYNKKLPKENSGGLFSGLSSAQSMALAAAGAAVVVGGLLLLTDVLDSNNNNNGGSGGGGGGRGDGGGGGTGGGTSTAAFTLPYGPAMPNAASETANYVQNLDYYSPSTAGVIKDNFTLMTNVYGQNYLLMMRGYSPLARGYMGMRTVRNTASRAPIDLNGNNLGSEPVMGGRPVNVALITTNGINAVDNSSLGERLMPWTTTNANGTVANGASNDMISSKYYNNKINRGTDNDSLNDDSTEEDTTILNSLDLSGSGTAINNSLASDKDNLLAKVVGGSDTGYTNADFIGFAPNAQLTVFRTGGGKGMKTASGTVSGSYVDTGSDGWADGDELNLFSKNLIITLNSNGSGFTATDGTDTYKGYIGADGIIYIDSDGDGIADQGYKIETGGDLTIQKELGDIDYANYKALRNAAALWVAGDVAQGRSRPDILANASIVTEMRGRDTETISDVLSMTDAARQAKFVSLINKYYDKEADTAYPGTDAAAFFGGLGSQYSPLVIFSTGSFETDSTYSGRTLEATFENSAPLVFDNLEHLFMSVVAVGLTGSGTNGTSTVSGYAPAGKISLSQWSDTKGTTDTSDDTYYKARMCGIAGRGANGIDPWCFAAAGMTDELAVASMAGATAAIKSAFDYLSNKQLFALLALTADGPYLGTNSSGGAMTAAELIAHLQGMYAMPEEHRYRWEHGGENYLDVFKEVFGYGLVNLERATKPTSKIYYYNGTDIVSSSGNAYWRAASRTAFSSSGALNPRAASISAPYYDILESVDGDLSLPRVWENEFALGTADVRGLYMGDVLGEFNVASEDAPELKVGALSFKMGFSEKSYTDSMGGLDNLQFGYDAGDLKMTAGYQRHFTDGVSRFDGTAHPILSMASNAVSSGAEYQFGNWSFGTGAFSGSITDEALLENDPTISSQYEPAKLGFIQGAQSNVTWKDKKFAMTASVGTARETDTLLGAYTDGLLALGNGNTTYVDALAVYSPSDDIRISLRSTFAKTTSDASGEFIMGMTDIDSNAFSIGADIGKFSFAAAMPLAVTNGHMRYAHADYEVIETEDGDFELEIKDTHIADLNLAPDARELRFSGAYRTKLGTFTDGAVGFIYRVNPNNIKDFGDEAILMFKVKHRIGI